MDERLVRGESPSGVGVGDGEGGRAEREPLGVERVGGGRGGEGGLGREGERDARGRRHRRRHREQHTRREGGGVVTQWG